MCEPPYRSQVMTRMVLSSRCDYEELSTRGYEVVSSRLWPEQYAAVGTTRVIELPREPLFTEQPNGSEWLMGRPRRMNVSRVARAVVTQPAEPEDNSSPAARELLEKGLQKAVEETMAFERGLGRMPAPWEG